ncbi:MAG: hypothetical protein WC809_09725 [Sinimarinibacterium sp.]|jgi:hypothetical protein
MSGSARPQGWSYHPAVTRITSLLTFAVATTLLYWGWTHRDRYYVSAEDGLGYTLGIVGGSLMLLLGLYPLRKHLNLMRSWGDVRHWFRTHMLFGIAGPLAILFHCNFGTGAINSNMALYSMLIVASSGLVGRYLYAKIHEGLYGRHVELGELRRSWVDARTQLDLHAHHLDTLGTALESYEAPLQTLRGSAEHALWRLPLAAWRRRRIVRTALRLLRADVALPPQNRDAALELLGRRLASAAAVYRYSAFDRLFGLWHLLHLPLYFMLIVTGVVHVVAVHMY